MQSESTAPAGGSVKRPQHPEGIEPRHKAKCASHAGRRCSCTPSYRAVVVVERHGDKRVRDSRTFPTQAKAVAWRREALVAVQQGRVRARSPITVRDAATQYIEGARSGAVRNRSGDSYKPSAIRTLEIAFRLRIVLDLGPRKLADVRRADLQRLVDRMHESGAAASSVRNTVNAVRALYRHAVQLDLVATDPTDGLALPAVRGRRDRIASPGEAEQLLKALPARDRALWAAAFYAGLRRGELRALLWSDVELASGVLRVERSWDDLEGPVAPKSHAGTRKVPITDALRTVLIEHRLAQGWDHGLVFGRSAERPFNPRGVANRADRVWRAAGLDRITLHECRHTYASMMIAAGVYPKALATYMGHASVTMTFDRYGHLMPGSESEAASRLDDYLSRARASGSRMAS